MSVSMLPNTTTAGGITSQASALGVPLMPTVTSGDQIYANREAATQALVRVGNGSLRGGGRFRMKRKTIRGRDYNNITKVMKGCSSKKTRRHNKKKRHGKRMFRGGANITPAVTGGRVEIPIPGGASPQQAAVLKSLTSGLFAAQTAGTNTVTSIPAPSSAASRFSGGGLSRRRHRNTKYRRLRYKKSIGRKSRSYRGSRRH
jgi:hypothetical protein